MVELYILGPTEIKSSEGNVKQSFLAGPKRLALLVYLLLKKPIGFHRRDSLLPLFWPDQGQRSARNSLSNMLYHIRKAIDEKAISNRGSEEVKLRSDTFWSDVIAFERYLKNGLPKKALKLYRGDLLKGFYIPEVAPDLDLWLDQERDRFCKMAFKASWVLADQAEEAEDFKAAQKWAKKAASFEPLCDQTNGRLIQLLHRTGNKREALLAYDNFVNRYRLELETEPPKELATLAKDIYTKEAAPLDIPKKHNIIASNKTPSHAYNKSIAILPFDSLGSNKNSFFADAAHSDLLVRLSKVADFKITSRTSVMAFKKSDKLLPEIANELGVKWILNGEVHETHNIIQINVRLVNGREDRMVWANTYQKELTAANVFQIQAEITKHITEALATQLARKESMVNEINPTNDLEAFCLQAQGRWILDKRTKVGIEQAIIYFQQALALDSQYIHAWIGLAEANIMLYKYGFSSDKSVLTEAEAALRKAMMVGPETAEINTIQALLHEAKREGPEAIKKYLQAISYRPNYAEAYSWLSWTHHMVGKSKEALLCAKRSVKLNPLSTEALGNLSLSWLSNGNYKKALSEAKRIQFFQPDWTTGHFLEGVTLYHQGLYIEASKKLQNLTVTWANSGPQFSLALAYISMQENKAAREIQDQLKRKHEDFGVAMIHAGFGENDECLKILSNMQKWDYWSVLSIHHFYPQVLAPLHADRRFEKVEQMVYLSYGVKK